MEDFSIVFMLECIYVPDSLAERERETGREDPLSEMVKMLQL